MLPSSYCLTSIKWIKYLSNSQNQYVKSPLAPPNVFTHLPIEAFGIETCSLLPRYATTPSKQITQTLNNPCHLWHIHQALVKFIASIYEARNTSPSQLRSLCQIIYLKSIIYSQITIPRTSRLNKYYIPNSQSPLSKEWYKSPFFPVLTSTQHSHT